MFQGRSWPEAYTKRLIELWERNLSASCIAAEFSKEFGNTLTRCAIIGKVHRLGLPTRPKDIQRISMRRTYKKKEHRPRARVFIAPRNEPLPEIVTDGTGILGLEWSGGKPSNCRAIIGGYGSETIYCGLPNKPGESFCRGHCMRYYNPPRERLATTSR